ncbi:molybdopterin-synthase adenylyltransferase MoeB [Hyunsoonleella sp. 2307UL5-6]|uniref:molybdopterin-synthase adenylyltransferase MoeB n=1 Tax=Hyunsoonleella sp. 2307UL5-6 TaxID=3384768 RepID=UPI0039BC9D20
MLSKDEKKQYNRHLILDAIGIEGQEKLKAAKVLVIGAGGLGCPILQYLAAAGVGTIGIIDNDTVDQSNLQRQILYTHDDIGKPKAQVAATKLARLNPFVQFNTYIEMLTKSNALDLFKAYDIIVDGSDNFPTRYLVNDAAVLTGKPLVFGAIFKFEGQVSVFNYKNGPTYRCLYPTAPQPGAVPNCSDIGVLGVLPGIIGSLQANEAIKIICEIGIPLSGKLLTYDTLTHRQFLLDFEKTDEANITTLETNYDSFCGIKINETIEDIALDTIKEHPDYYNLLDVREDNEREIFHIGGQHIPLGELQNRYTEVNSAKPLVVYCKSGMRSAKAIEILSDFGFKNQLLKLQGILEEN